ncbi:MAG: dihydrodipicolinate synthase family protein [Pseudomonadota bacterium]
MDSLSGVWAAALTPIDEAGCPRLDQAISHGQWLLENGCDGLGVLGSTGEANSLGLDRRDTLIAGLADALPREKLLVGTGGCALEDTVRLTRTSLDSGVNRVLVLPPFFYRPADPEGVMDFFDGLIAAIGTTDLRLYLYNFPQLTGFAFPVDWVRRLKDRHGDIVAGLKDSSGDFSSMQGFVSVPEFAVFAGTETYLLDILKVGGVGCISASANVTSPGCQAVYAAWRNGQTEMAEALQRELTDQRAAVQALPMIPAVRALTAARTGDESWRQPLPPHRALAPAAVNELSERLFGSQAA